MIDVLNRPLQGWWSPRYGAIYRTPAAAIFGPKVMITNEMAGSGGDLMPWMFRYTHIGTLVGKHTWGSLIGVSQYPTLMDGGAVTAPNFGFFSDSPQSSRIAEKNFSLSLRLLQVALTVGLY